MDISSLMVNGRKGITKHSPEILTGMGVAGVFITSYLAGKASYEMAMVDEATQWTPTLKERVKEHWKLYIPVVLSGGVTVACIIGASKASGRRTAAAVTAYSLTEKAFSEYKDKVVEQIGENKERKVRDEIAQDRVDKSSNEVIFVAHGNVLFCEAYTMRFFRSDMETVKKAEVTINQRIYQDMYVMLSEFYDLIGLPPTSVSDYLGWDSGNQMELRWSTTMTEGMAAEPALMFDYNYVKPIA